MKDLVGIGERKHYSPRCMRLKRNIEANPMKTMSALFAALCCVVPFSLSAQAAPGFMTGSDAPIWLAGSSDGGSLPGAPGGRGGESGAAAFAGDDVAALMHYCATILEMQRPPRGHADFRPSDCANYFLSLDDAWADAPFYGRPGRYGHKSDGTDGPSIAGGVGGRGGRAGAGPGGGSGGSGGGGFAGGVGGRGGAGGASD